MAVKTTAELLVQVAGIAGNGSNSLTGDQIGTILKDMIESYVNTSTNALDLVTNAIRSDNFLAASGTVTVTFNNPIGTTNYNVFFDDPNGLITAAASAKTVNGFDIAGNNAGVVRYLAVIEV